MRPLHVDEIATDEALLRELLQNQLPHLSKLKLSAIDSAGADNWLFRLGGDLLIRLPRRPDAALQVSKTHEWLPHLAPGLPLQVPTPIALGSPCAAFPWPWSVYSWIQGEVAEPRFLASSADSAIRLGRFVRALQDQDTLTGPPPGRHNSYRGEPLLARNEVVRQNLNKIADPYKRDLAFSIWAEALAVEPHPGAPMWLHGDLLPSNLLVADGALVAVLDFGLLAVGDPACDLMAGWSLFDSEAREVFRRAVNADPAAWSRGRGWALAFAAVALPYYEPLGHPLATIAARTLIEVLSSEVGATQ